MPWRRPQRLLILLISISCRSEGSQDTRGVVEAASPPGTASGVGADSAAANYFVAGDSVRLIEHPEILPAGFPLQIKPLPIKNPYEADKRAIAIGARLFVGYNCLDCHGADGSGAMGPSFQDGRWHFGGSAGDVFESIYQGRPDGMPAWGGRISNDQIWMLTAYVRSLSSKDLSTENFTGKTVERTGH